MKTLNEMNTDERAEFAREAIGLAINKMMERFDFGKAAAALRGCDWRFIGDEHSPTEEALRRSAQSILLQAAEMGGEGQIKAGPLCAEVKGWHPNDAPEVLTIRLSLMPVWRDEVYVDARRLNDNHEPSTEGQRDPA